MVVFSGWLEQKRRWKDGEKIMIGSQFTLLYFQVGSSKNVVARIEKKLRSVASPYCCTFRMV